MIKEESIKRDDKDIFFGYPVIRMWVSGTRSVDIKEKKKGKICYNWAFLYRQVIFPSF